MSADRIQLSGEYVDSRPPLTAQDFTGIVENQVLDVVFEPHMEGPRGEKALGHLEEVAHLDDEVYGSADFYRIRLSEDQGPDEQQRSFLHEVLHIYFGGLAKAIALTRTRQVSSREALEEHLQAEEVRVEAETQRFYRAYPDLVRQTFSSCCISR